MTLLQRQRQPHPIRYQSSRAMLLSLICASLFVLTPQCSAQRIAVIGGGISGTFVTRYLAELDQNCSLEALTIFDPMPLGAFTTTKESSESESSADHYFQGSRVATLKLEDGRIMELGGSIISEQFLLINEMAEAGNLTVGKPFDTGIPDENVRKGMVIYDGNGEIALNTAAYVTDWEKKFGMLWRYNLDLWLLSRAVTSAIQKFSLAQEHLLDPEHYFYESPMEMWKAVGADNLVQQSMDAHCDQLWVSSSKPGSWWWGWKQSLGLGSLRQELLSAINLVNYNQDNTQVNAFTGLASFSVVSVPVYSIQGGNVQLMSSAFEQAQNIITTTRRQCKRMTKGKNSNSNNDNDKDDDDNRMDNDDDDDNDNDKDDVIVSHERQRISTIVGNMNGFDLFAEGGSMIGNYDIVILATPLAMAKINFLVQSHIDESVLQPMPLGGLITNTEEEDQIVSKDPYHEGHSPLPHKLPKAALRPYTRVITTVVQHAELQTDYFQIDPQHKPRGIYMTPKSRLLEHTVTSIAQISSADGLYKVFSSQPLSRDVLMTYFGPAVQVTVEKDWGGPHGGATPDYQGVGDTTGFLLYDGATGFHGHTKSGALYYPNALELTLACVETSAMGAKAVAKLIAKRLGWIRPDDHTFGMGEEL